MDQPLIECVPNFSEGRNLSTINKLIHSIPPALLLGHESDSDHNRTVLTLAGPPDLILPAVIQAALLASQEIDITQHHGVHPRIGSTDVIPFIPLANITMDATAALARHAAAQLWQQAQIPSYLYEFAALKPERTNLEAIRKLGFEALRHRPDLPPDIGGPALHPTAGASAIGARRFLIACNVNLASGDLSLAKRIARSVRTSSGGFPFVKALGLPLPSKNIVQVSMNLTHFEITSLATVFARIKQQAAVDSTEIIGFPPRAALAHAEDFLALCQHWTPDRILENRLQNLRPSVDL